MTATYELPLSHSKRVRIRSSAVEPSRVCIVIPTYNDWDGLRETLKSLSGLDPAPGKIVVVNDNKDNYCPSWLSEFGVAVKDYCGNRGPAFARNAGFGFYDFDSAPEVSELDNKIRKIKDDDERLSALCRYGFPEKHDHRLRRNSGGIYRFFSKYDWFYFTDCGCRHSTDLLKGFATTRQEEGDSVIAICGSVSGVGDGKINRYMTEQGILNPPLRFNASGGMEPQAIITANALICGLAFSYLGGFDIDFPEAAGEDIDLGVRLSLVGSISYNVNCIVWHAFNEDVDDFTGRFRRYGRGMRKFEVKHNLPSLRASHFKSDIPELQDLADLQVQSMREGYDSACSVDDQGLLIESRGNAWSAEDVLANRVKMPFSADLGL